MHSFGEEAGGSYVTRVALESSDLVLRWQAQSARRGYEDWNKAPARTLITNVEMFEVAYRHAFGEDWTMRPGDPEVPNWLRFRIKANGRFWPDIVVQVPR